MESKASARYQRIQPRKLRLVVNMIRGRGVDESLNVLQETHTKGARMITKVLNSAIANAVDRGEDLKIEPEMLYVKRAFVDGGPVMKRFRPRAMGRATRILKRTSHITIVLDVHDEHKAKAEE